jgi:hypothetical protein
MKHGFGFHLLIVLLFVLSSPWTLIAQGHKGKNKKATVENRSALLAFSMHDQRAIREYFGVNAGNLPPGLAKRGGSLPPGLEKQLRKNGTLPPGLQKQIQPFPPELERRLPPLPPGCVRVVIGAQAVILDRMKVIHDLMYIR